MSEPIRFDILMKPRKTYGDLPPVVTLAGYPPAPGETAREYHRRVSVQILSEIYAPKPTLVQRLRAFLGLR